MIEDQLRDALHAQADATPVHHRELPAGGPPVLSHRRRLLAAAAAVTVVVLGGALVALEPWAADDVQVATEPPKPSTTMTMTSATTTPARPELGPGPVLDDEIVFLFSTSHDDADPMMAVLRDGSIAPLHGLGPHVRLAPDGRTIIYGRFDQETGANVETIALDTRTGAQRSLGALGRDGGYYALLAEVSPSGRTAFSVEHDADRRPRIVIAAPGTFVTEQTVVLPSAAADLSVIGMAWDTDGRHVLVFAWDTENRWSWSMVDADAGTATPVAVPDDINVTQHETFWLGAAHEQGAFPVLLGAGWGTLHVTPDGSASFEKSDPPGPEPLGDHAVVRFWDVGMRSIARAGGDRFVIRDDGPGGGRLVYQWEMYDDRSGRLLYVAADGAAETLLEGLTLVEAASRP